MSDLKLTSYSGKRTIGKPMDANYQEVLERIVKDRSNDGRGIQQQNSFHDVVASFNVLLKEPNQRPPHYTEVEEKLVRLGMTEENARDVRIVYRTLKTLHHGIP